MNIPVPPTPVGDLTVSSLRINNSSKISGTIYGEPTFVGVNFSDSIFKDDSSAQGSVLVDVWAYASNVKEYPLGTLLKQNGSTYRYCSVFGGLERGNLATSRITTSIFDETITAVGVKSITIINNTGGNIVENDFRYVDGFMQGTGTTGNPAFGISLYVTGCTAAANGEAVTFNMNINSFNPADFGFTVGQDVSITSSKYVTQTAVNSATVTTTYNQEPVGVYTNGSGGGTYHWIQTSGTAAIKCDAAPTIAQGQLVGISTNAGSSGRINGLLQNTGDPPPPIVGRAMAAGVANKFIPVFLQLE